MALRSLRTTEMVHVTGTLLAEDSPARRVMESHAMLQGFLPVLERVDANVRAVAAPVDDSRLRGIIEESSTADATFDRIGSHVSGLLVALAGLTDDASEAERYEAISARLLPDGVAATVHDTFEGEAGHAERLATSLTPEFETQLSSVVVGRRTLLDIARLWIRAGQRLGELERERLQVEAELKQVSASLPSTRSVRNDWIRAMSTLRATAELAGLDADEMRALFATLDEVEAYATQRSGRRSAATSDVAPRADAGAPEGESQTG